MRCESLLPEAARVMANDGLDYMLTQVKINTPESHPPVGGVPEWPYVPGGDGTHLRDEIHRTEVIEIQDGYEGQVGSDKDYAPFVEEGTGEYGPKHAKYLIEPHNPDGVLVFPWMGQVRFFKRVWHPGSPGQHMFLIGGELTDDPAMDWSLGGQMLLRMEME